jgi:hypothetical protein
MQSLRMLAGAVALAAPTPAFLAAFNEDLPWPGFAGIVVVCIAVLAAMDYWRVPVPSHDRAGRS